MVAKSIQTSSSYSLPQGSSPFKRLISLDTLTQAWSRVAANRSRGAAGGDGVSVAAYAEGVGVRLARLSRDLETGTYVPGPLRRLDLRKPDGGIRTLMIPCVNDRVGQTAAHLVLQPILEPEFEDSSYGYRPGRSVAQAVNRVAALRRQGYVWAVDGDIEKFFDTVPHGPLLERLAQHVPDPDLARLMALWLDSFSAEERGLAQGSPISPLLANLYLDAVDEAIERDGVRFVRFADDFVILCRSETAAEKARERMAQLLAAHGLRLHPDKTRIVAYDRKMRFLGHLFLRSIMIAAQAQEEDEAAAAIAAGGPLPPPAPPAASEADLPRPGPPVDAPPPLPAPPARAEIDAVLGPAPKEGEPRSPVIRPLHVREAGRRLSATHECFLVIDGEAPIASIHASQVGRIEVGPQADADALALRLAAEHGLELALVDGSGETIAALQPAGPGRAARHLAQAAAVLDPARRLAFARAMAEGRIRNQRALLTRLDRRRKDEKIREAREALKRAARAAATADSVQAAMGHEGNAGRIFWPALMRAVDDEFFRFATRRRRPPPDAANLVVSFLASLLLRDVGALIGRSGLHPGFAFLHATEDREESLVFDLAEAFRAPLVEGLAVYLFNNQILKQADFAVWEDGRCRMDPLATRTLIRWYETWLGRPIVDPASKTKVHWRRLIELDIEAFARSIEAGAVFRPYRMDT